MKVEMFNRQRFCAVSFILAAALSLGGACANTENAGAKATVESLKITGAPDTAVDLSEKSVQLGVEYSPEENVAPFAVRWYCDGQSVATVNESGIVTLLSAGKVVISASVIGKREISDKVTIEVKSEEQTVSSLRLTGRPENDTVSFPCEPFTLSYISEPENAEEFSAEWYSTSENVATIDEKGEVRVHGKGATEIGVRVRGKKSVSDSFVLYVGGAPRVREIAISGKPQKNTMRAGTSTFLSCEYLPQDCGWFKDRRKRRTCGNRRRQSEHHAYRERNVDFRFIRTRRKQRARSAVRRFRIRRVGKRRGRRQLSQNREKLRRNKRYSHRERRRNTAGRKR